MSELFLTLIVKIYEYLAVLVKTGKAEIFVVCFLIPSYFTLIIFSDFEKYKIRSAFDGWKHHRYYHFAMYLLMIYLTIFDISLTLQSGQKMGALDILFIEGSLKFFMLSAWLIEAIISAVYYPRTFQSTDLEIKIFAKDLALLGSFLIIDCSTTVTFFIGVEAVSFATYALLACEKRPAATSALVTYFMYSVVGSIFLVLGFLVLYVETGQISLLITHIANPPTQRFIAYSYASVLFLVGIFIKLGVGPFYHWTPMVYEEVGAENFVLVSVLIKIPLIGAIFLLRDFEYTAYFIGFLMIAIIAGLSTMLSEIGSEKNFRRILAYTSATNITFAVGTLIISDLDYAAVITFLIAYFLSFTVTFEVLHEAATYYLQRIERTNSDMSEDDFLRSAVITSVLITSGLPLITVFFFKLYMLGSTYIGYPKYYPLNGLDFVTGAFVLFLFVVNIIVYKAYFVILKKFAYIDGVTRVSDDLYNKLAAQNGIKAYIIGNIIFSMISLIIYWL